MDEKITAVAEFSTLSLQQDSESKQKQSLLGALFPLLAPICILLYMFTEEIDFRDLSSTAQFLFLGALIASAILFGLHSKAVTIEKEKLYSANRTAEKQSLIVTNSRIYGRTQSAEFSHPYCEIDKAYCSYTVGQPSVLIIKLASGNRLEFQYIQNPSSIISCINDCTEKSQQKNICEPTVSAKTMNCVPSQPMETQDEPLSLPNNNSYENSTCKLYNIVITSGSGSLSQIKALRQITLCDLNTAKSAFSQLPYTVAESKEAEDAVQIKRTLEATGMTVTMNII